ncbi:MAG: DUF4250 domain-containing protein [Clostridium sp.]|nr:DUF4250 domain-containing protein [Clostridium sp.]MDY3829305.1 DUF4250 domain-containing protein [Clostridium sp.]
MDINMDANILLSIINMKLRDFYSNLDYLCDDLDINKSDLIEKLSQINYSYSKANNQFI